MNKNIAILITGVIILALLLIMASQYKSEEVAQTPSAPAQPTENTGTVSPGQALTPPKALQADAAQPADTAKDMPLRADNTRADQNRKGEKSPAAARTKTPAPAEAATPPAVPARPQAPQPKPQQAENTAAPVLGSDAQVGLLTPPPAEEKSPQNPLFMPEQENMPVPAVPQAEKLTPKTKDTTAAPKKADETSSLKDERTAKGEKASTGNKDEKGAAAPLAADPQPNVSEAAAQTAASQADATLAKPEKADAVQAAPPAPATAVGKPRAIERITVRRDADGTNVLFSLSEQTSYKSMRLTDPDRLVVDFPGNWEVRAPGVPTNKFVTNVRIGKYAKITRVVLDLQGTPASTKFYKSGKDDIEIRLR